LFEQEDLFDLAPKENKGEIERTEIEYLQLAFSDGKKREMIIMMESLMVDSDDVYSELLYRLIKEKYEEDNS